MLQGRLVGIEGNIQNSDLVAVAGLNFVQQTDVAFDAGDQFRFAGISQPQLMQRGNTIGVAVKHIDMAMLRMMSVHDHLAYYCYIKDGLSSRRFFNVA